MKTEIEFSADSSRFDNLGYSSYFQLDTRKGFRLECDVVMNGVFIGFIAKSEETGNYAFIENAFSPVSREQGFTSVDSLKTRLKKKLNA